MARPDVLVVLEAREGPQGPSTKRASREALSLGRKLAGAASGKLAAVVLGSHAPALAAALRGPEIVYVSADPIHDRLHAEAMGAAIGAAIDDLQPGVVLLAASTAGRELAPLAAHRLGTAVAADVIDVRAEGDALEVRRPIFAGKAIAVLRCPRPAVVTIRPNAFPIAEESAAAPPRRVDLPAPAASSFKSRVAEVLPSPAAGKLELTEADIIVSGGRGLKGPEHFALLEELAGPLNAAVGASRAVCDAGWRPHSDQVGQTGKTVCPRLYIACGISGAIQHLAGMSSSKCIVAINKDRSAPIFQAADYGIVGDVFEVIPELSRRLKGHLGS